MIAPTALLFWSVNVLFVVPFVVGAVVALIGYIKASESLNRRMTFIGATLCALAALGPFVVAAYVGREGWPVKIILPAKWSGEFSIVKDRKTGAPPEFVDGAWVFRIPNSGALIVSDDHPFYRWHMEVIVDENGAAVFATGHGIQAGEIRTGPGSWRASSDYDGTTHRWTVERD